MKRKTNIIIGIVIAVVTLALIVTIIVAAVKNGRQPENPVGPSTDITTPPEKPDDPNPVIPPIDSDSGTETDKPEDSSPADITIDVVRPKDDPHEDTPGVVGDVVIQPGIKEGEE
mgnify:FL=1